MGIVRWVRLKLATREPITMATLMSRRTFLGLAAAATATGAYMAYRAQDRIISPPVSSAREVEPTRRLLERFELQEGNLYNLTRDRIGKSILAEIKGNEGLGGYFLIKSGAKVVDKTKFSDFGDLQNNIWDALIGSGYIDRNGKVSIKFDGTRENFGLGMPLSNSAVDKVFDVLQNAGSVNFIHSPTQFGQIVSEGMGYWMKILTNAARRLDLGSVSKTGFSEFGELQEHIWNALVERKYIRKYIDENGNENGRILINFDGTKDNFGLNMPLNDGEVNKVFTILQKSHNKENRAVLLEYQAVLNGLIWGTIEMINENPSGLPGWRCYYNPTKSVTKSDFSGFGELQNNIWDALRGAGYIDADGKILNKFDGKQENFSLNMPLHDEATRQVFTVLEKASVVKNIEFRSEQERASATDADLYIADALMDAELLAREGIFEASPEFQYREKRLDYTGLTDHLLSRIKAYDVEEMNGRHILRVSDMWGSRDFKGALTYNPSYARLAVLFRMAQRDADRDFWLKLRHDSFELIRESYQFAQSLYRKMLESKQIIKGADKEGNEVEWVKLDGPEARLLESLMVKLTPQEDAELKALINERDVNKKILEYKEDHLAFVEGQSVRANLDGSRDIRKDVFDLIIQKIEEYQVQLFFPDQVEVEVNERGEYLLRPEIGARNLNFTEGYDAIRIYAEIGEDLLMNNDTMDNRVPEEYRISGREYLLLEELLREKALDPKLVRANCYHNAVALSAYFMARAGLATYEKEEIDLFDKFRNELEAYIGPIRGDGQTDIFDFINTQAKRGPQYYNASLALKILTSFLARDTEYRIEAANIEKVTRPAKPGDALLPYAVSNPDIDYLLRTVATDFNRLAEYLTRNELPEINQVLREQPREPIFTVEAEGRYLHAKANLMVDSPKSQDEFGKTCLSVGRYHEAAQVFFELLRDAPSPDKPIDEIIVTEAIRRLTDILGTLNVPRSEIEDLFEWLLKREGNVHNRKTAYLRLAYIKQLNESRRVTRALAQEKILFEEIAQYFKPGTAWEMFRDDARGAMLSGDNGRAPLPAQELLAAAAAEMVFSYANTYEIQNDEHGFPRKIYNREGARLLAYLAITEGTLSHAPITDPTLQKLAEWVRAVKDRIPENTRSQIHLAMARSDSYLANHVKEEIDSRLAFPDWHNYYYIFEKPAPDETAIRDIKAGLFDLAQEHKSDLPYSEQAVEYLVRVIKQEGPVHRTIRVKGRQLLNEYLSALPRLEEAVENFSRALETECAQAAAGSRLAEILDGLISVYEAKIKILVKLEEEEMNTAYNIAQQNGVETPNLPENQPRFAKEIQNIFETLESGRELSSKEMQTFAFYIEILVIHAKYQNEIKSLTDQMKNLAGTILGGFGDPVSVKWSEMTRIGLSPDLIKQAVHLIVNEEPSADPRNIRWGFWVMRIIKMYHGIGINNRDRTFLDDALRLSLRIPGIWVSSSNLHALSVIETTLKRAEILFGYNDLPDLRIQYQALTDNKNNMYASLQALLDGPDKFRMPENISAETRSFINDIFRCWPDIEKIFALDPTQRAKILTSFGNLKFWNVKVEYEIEYEALPKEQNGRPNDESLNILRAKYRMQYAEALTKYEKALEIDPYILDALNGAIQMSYELENDRLAFYYLVRTLRAMAGTYVNLDKQREILGKINMLKNERGVITSEDYVELTPEEKAALEKAAAYKETFKELNLYHLSNLLEFFRTF